MTQRSFVWHICIAAVSATLVLPCASGRRTTSSLISEEDDAQLQLQPESEPLEGVATLSSAMRHDQQSLIRGMAIDPPATQSGTSDFGKPTSMVALESAVTDIAHAAGTAALEANGYWKDGHATEKAQEFYSLPLCRLIPSVCKMESMMQDEHARLPMGLAASVRMRQDLAGVGAFWVGMVIAVCFAFRLCLDASGFGSRLPPEDLVEMPSQDDEPISTSWQGQIKSWWTDGWSFARPVLAMRTFVAGLLLLELACLNAPEMTILTTPEVLGLYRAYPVMPPSVPRLTRALLPGLETNPEFWVNVLSYVRLVLLGAWTGFIVIPYNAWGLSGPLYAVGAVAYFLLSSLGLQYNLGHSSQATCAFVLLAAFACGDLERPRTAAWLRKCLVHGILAPMYLACGLSKLRFVGPVAMLNGEWIATTLAPSDRAASEALLMWVNGQPIFMPLLSIGNFVIEFILPAAVLLVRGPGQRVRLVEGMFLLMCCSFHIAIFILIGPNFIRNFWLEALALESILFCGEFPKFRRDADDSSTACRDWGRAVIAQIVLLIWFLVQFRSFLLHMLGIYAPDEKSDPMWPVPECSMFADPPRTQLFSSPVLRNTVTTMATCAILVGYLWTIATHRRLESLQSSMSKKSVPSNLSSKDAEVVTGEIASDDL